MKRIWKYLREFKKYCVLAPLFKMLEATFELFVPLVVASIIDKGIGASDINHILKMSLMLIILAVIGLTVSITAQYFSAKAAIGCATSMRHGLFSHIQSFSFSNIDECGVSTIITRMTSDINQVQDGVNLTLRLFLRSPFIVFGAMIMAFTIDFKAALIFAVTIPLLALVVFGIMFTTRPLYIKVQAGLDKILAMTRENMTGVRVIRAFNQENVEKEAFFVANDDLTKLSKFTGKISALMNPMTYLIVNGAIIVLIYIGAVRVNSGSLSQGQVVALYNYMSQILVELIKLANLIINITKALASAKRIDDMFNVESDMQEGSIEAMKPADEDNAVEFNHVSLRYKGGGDEAISDINFVAKAGQIIGVIGGTGSGKSSLVNLIPRYYDISSGQLKIFGQDVKDYSYKCLRDNVVTVLQKARLFKGSIRENLLMAQPDASEADMWEALEVSQSKEFVEKKAKGLDEFVEQGGKNLSGGQRQRLTIARAVIKKPRILILDDSSSALDYATDAALRKAIKNMEEAPTLFIVSQRAASLMYADQIIVLDDGHMVGLGSHEDLLASCKEYQEIYYSQFRKEERA